MAASATADKQAIMLADPERALAVSYAPAAARTALAVLFAFDERLGAVVGGAGETGIGLIRLAWWREAVEALGDGPPPPEPLLAAIAAELLPRGVGPVRLAELEQGWSVLFDTAMDAAAIARHGRLRGAVLFALAGQLLGRDDPRLADLGAGWALADLGHRHSQPAVRAEARRQAAALLDPLAGSWPRALRPLAALGRLARTDAHVAGARRQGSPARIARMLALRITGR